MKETNGIKKASVVIWVHVSGSFDADFRQPAFSCEVAAREGEEIRFFSKCERRDYV